jgi:hypothetical protein
MPVPRQHEVEAALSPYNDRIRRAVAAGFKVYVRKIAGAPNLLKRTDAVDVFDSVAQALIGLFRDDSKVRVFEARGTFKILFGGRVLARFKKAGSNGRGMNLRTHANDRFLNPTLPFEDAPDAAKVEICWTVNQTETSYETLHVVARNGDGALWSYELPGSAQIPLPLPKPGAPAPERQRVAKLKGAKRDKDRDAS